MVEQHTVCDAKHTSIGKSQLVSCKQSVVAICLKKMKNITLCSALVCLSFSHVESKMKLCP